MERAIMAGSFNDFNKVKFYNGEKVLAFGNPRYSGIILPDNWKDNITVDNDWIVNERAEGFMVDDGNARNARKVNLTKNDVFRMTEKDSTGDRLLNLYVPAKITPLGTVEKDRDKFGHSVYNRYKVEAPLQCSCHVVKDIGKEAMDKIYASGKVLHGKYFYDEAGRQCELMHREGRPERNVPEAYLLVTTYYFTVPYFYHEEYVKEIHNEYYDKCEKMAEKFKEITSEHISCWDIDRLLNVYDITEKENI